MQVLLLRRRRCPLSRTPFGSPNFFVYTPVTPLFSSPCVSKFYSHLRAHRYTLKAYQHTSVLPDQRNENCAIYNFLIVRGCQQPPPLANIRHKRQRYSLSHFAVLPRPFATPVGAGGLRFALPLRSLPLSAPFASPRWWGSPHYALLPLVRVGKKIPFSGVGDAKFCDIGANKLEYLCE